MSTDDDLCGHPTGEGEPCQNKATEGDSCWIEAHGGHASGGGRPSKFNDELARDAIHAARQGKSKTGCARAAGVGESTLMRWVDKSPEFVDGDGETREFRPAFRRARSDGETLLVHGGLRDGDVDSQMARFLLSTSYDYVKTEKRELEHSTAGDFWRNDAQDDDPSVDGEHDEDSEE